jgi:hypothetical protein
MEPIESMDPVRPPAQQPSGGRARAFVIARYAVYALIVAVGGFHLLNRDTASGGETEPAGRWISGSTTQQLPISVKVDERRVVVVDLRWRGTCEGGGTITWGDGFVDAHEGDFVRDGDGYRDDWEKTETFPDGRSGRLRAELQGSSAGGVTRGSIDFELEILDGGEQVDSCESGPIGYAIDLQG